MVNKVMTKKWLRVIGREMLKQVQHDTSLIGGEMLKQVQHDDISLVNVTIGSEIS